jgi:hypothetical protein
LSLKHEINKEDYGRIYEMDFQENAEQEASKGSPLSQIFTLVFIQRH